jgi:hypothetical protein
LRNSVTSKAATHNIGKRPNGNIRAWIKCLLTNDVLKSVDPKNEQGKKIVEHTAQKIKRGYVPPNNSSRKNGF